MKIKPTLLGGLLVLGLAAPALAYRGSGRTDTEPPQSKQRYSYVSLNRSGAGRRSMRKETKQVQTWTLE